MVSTDGVSPSRIFANVRGERMSLQEHRVVHGPAPDGVRIEEVDRAGLLGRGGGAFKTAIKMRAVAAAGGRRVVVANGAEGEPASQKDKALLALVPHLVLDGATAAARAVGAKDVVVCVPRGVPGVRASVEKALMERRGLERNGIRFRIEAVPDRYIAGEESALVHWLNGGPAKPTLVPPRPFQKGVDGRPTLIQNVETLTSLALVARHGAVWYRTAGRAEEPGTRLLTVSGGVARPGVYEVPTGSSLDAAVAAAGGATGRLQAFLFGGYFGSWFSADAATAIPLMEAEVRRKGGSLGCGVVVALPSEACGVLEIARVARYLANETADQCGPCVHGLASVAGALEALVSGKRDAIERLPRWLEQIEGRGACHHPNGAIRFVASGLRVFAQDVERHRRREPCRAFDRKPVLPVPRHEEGWR